MWNVPISMRLVLYVRCLRQVLLSGLSQRYIPDIGTVTGGMSEIRFFSSLIKSILKIHYLTH